MEAVLVILFQLDYKIQPPQMEATHFQKGLQAVAKEDEVTLLLMPDASILNESQYISVVNWALEQCNVLQDRFTIIDVKGAKYEDKDAESDDIVDAGPPPKH